MKTQFTLSLCLLAALVIALVLGCGPAAPSAQVNEGLASPQIVAGPSTPRFLSGDTALADAGPNDWVLIDQKRDDNHYLVQDYVKKGQTGTTWGQSGDLFEHGASGRVDSGFHEPAEEHS